VCATSSAPTDDPPQGLRDRCQAEAPRRLFAVGAAALLAGGAGLVYRSMTDAAPSRPEPRMGGLIGYETAVPGEVVEEPEPVLEMKARWSRRRRSCRSSAATSRPTTSTRSPRPRPGPTASGRGASQARRQKISPSADHAASRMPACGLRDHTGCDACRHRKNSWRPGRRPILEPWDPTLDVRGMPSCCSRAVEHARGHA